MAVVTKAVRGASEAKAAGYSDVQLFIKAPNVTKEGLLDFAQTGPLTRIPTERTISEINVMTKDGWVVLPDPSFLGEGI
jgi:hypothetical protein